MNKLLLYFSTAAVTVMLASCNLFIDDELDENSEFKNVPVHTGVGYDEPVTTNEGGCEVTYQYNSDVRVLSQEDQDRYIVYAAKDGANCFAEVHYSKNTPADKLPVPGEILLSTVTERFPWGCNHRVHYCIEEDNVYRYILGFAALDETFKELDINGNISNDGKDEYVIPAEDFIVDDEETDTIAATRSDWSINVGIAKISWDGDTIQTDIPFIWTPGQIEYKGGYGSATLEWQSNYKENFNFDHFSIKKRNFKMKYTMVQHEKFSLSVAGGYTHNGRLFRVPLVRGKAIVIPTPAPIVLVLFLNADLSLDFDINASVTWTKETKTKTTYDIDLVPGFMELPTVKETTEKLIHKPLSFGNFALESSLTLSSKLIVGLGIYGKVLSVRLIPTLALTIASKVPLAENNGSSTYNISTKEGVTLTLDFILTIGVYLDLKLKEILGNVFIFGDDVDKANLEAMEADAAKMSEYYKDVVDNQNESLDPKNKKYYKKGEGHEEEDAGLATSFKWHILGPYTTPWFPTIHDNSFAIVRGWDKEAQKMTFTAQYTIDKLGIIAAGTGVWFVPCINITEGAKQIKTVYPTEGGKSAKVRSGHTYYFNLPELDDDKTYMIWPVYYNHQALNTSSVPSALDKGLSFCLTTPNLSIIDVKPTDLKYEGEVFHDDYTYCYNIYVDTKTSVKGMDNIKSWDVKETFSDAQYEYKTKKEEKDGIYIMHWLFNLYTDYPNVVNEVRMAFYPSYKLKVDGDNSYHTGDSYSILVCTDRTYWTVDTGDGTGMGAIPFSRKRTSEDYSKYAIEGRIVAVETLDGEIIWKCPGYEVHKPDSTTIPFRRL
jgi:hypothetical protein